jgi:hypothetical protein
VVLRGEPFLVVEGVVQRRGGGSGAGASVSVRAEAVAPLRLRVPFPGDGLRSVGCEGR